jgi:hypothetical protein
MWRIARSLSLAGLRMVDGGLQVADARSIVAAPLSAVNSVDSV